MFFPFRIKPFLGIFSPRAPKITIPLPKHRDTRGCDGFSRPKLPRLDKSVLPCRIHDKFVQTRVRQVLAKGFHREEWGHALDLQCGGQRLDEPCFVH